MNDYSVYTNKHEVKKIVSKVIATAREYAYFETPEQVDNFDWSKYPSFVVKSATLSNHVLIKREKYKFDFPAVIDRIKGWLNSGGVLVEKHLGDKIKEYKLNYSNSVFISIESGGILNPTATNKQQIIDKGNELAKLFSIPDNMSISIYSRETKTCCRTINDLFFGGCDIPTQVVAPTIVSKSVINKNMELSIVIPYHNEGVDFIATTVNSIKETIDVTDYEIIVVDDFSDIPLKFDGATVLRHNENKGVGAAFDTGVEIAQSDNLFLMGSDIRFVANGWASKMIAEIKNHPKAFTCTSCVALNTDAPENMDINKRRLVNVLDGATILMFHDQKSNPAKNSAYRSIIEAKWLPHMKDRNIDSSEIPCILGAAYGVSKKWYDYIDGWALHKKWGTLEPYISLKSWFFGGSCRMDPRIETGHIFKKQGTHGTQQDILFYNKMMVATVLLEDYQRVISFLPNNSIIKRSREIYNANLKGILAKREEYKKKIIVNQQEFFDRWGIDYRPEYK